jgi:TRAP-type uncharacterized transport system substrate-binding protein
MRRSPVWLGLAVSIVSILAGHCAGARESGDLQPTAQKPDQKQRTISAGSQLRHAIRDQVNSGLVTIILGALDGGDLSDATDLVTSLKDAHLRVLPVAGEGAKKDVIDLLFARGIDIGIVQTDVLASLKQQPPFPRVENFLQYITKLYDQEVHILARREIHSIEDLASKPVNFGILESDSFLTASRIFAALGIGVEITTLPQPLALEKLRQGEIAALVYTAAKPARLFQAIRPEEGVHFLPISASNALREGYGHTTLSAWDYPSLIKEGNPVSTLSVGTILAVYNWPVGTERYRNVTHFVETFFGRLAELRMSRHHPKWREVNIYDSVAGWTRFEPATLWIKSAERDIEQPNRFAGRTPLLTEGSTSAPAPMPSTDAGDMERSTEPVVHHPESVSADYNGEVPLLPSTASPREPSEKHGGDRISLDAQQRDALFREFVEYQQREAQGENPSQNEALFAEFQTYVKHLLKQPDRQLTGASADRSTVPLPRKPARGSSGLSVSACGSQC